MRYDSRVDDVILKILCTQQKCSYLELKRKVDYVFSKWRMNRRLNPSISFETFTFHLKKLVELDMVKRQEESIERSSIVNYSITGEVNCYKYKEMSYLDILTS